MEGEERFERAQVKIAAASARCKSLQAELQLAERDLQSSFNEATDALNSIMTTATAAASSRQILPPAGRIMHLDCCISWNAWRCSTRNCAYKHVCGMCQAVTHRAIECPIADPKMKSRVPQMMKFCLRWNLGYACSQSDCIRVHACMGCDSARHTYRECTGRI